MSPEPSKSRRRTARSSAKHRATSKGSTSKSASKSSPKTGSGASGKGGPRSRPSLEEVFLGRDAAGLDEIARFWFGNSNDEIPSQSEPLQEALRERMSNGTILGERIDGLGRRLGQAFAVLMDSPSYRCTLDELRGHRVLEYLDDHELDATLSMLVRHGLVVECGDARDPEADTSTFGVPVEIGDGVLRLERDRRRGLFDALTLRGSLDRMYDDPSRARRTPPTRVREMYKMYSSEAAAVARIERLPEGLQGLVEKTVLQFGGLLPRSLFERMESDLPHWNARRWKKILEESLIGTVDRLELGRYGIQHADETLIVYNEVSLAWLRKVAVPGDPDAPHSEASLGVDLVSNISRFIAFIMEHNVRFTVRGEIFKTTEKRIVAELIPNPGRELERTEVLTFIYEFCRGAGLIENTGERTFAVTTQGRHWEQRSLDDKLRTLIDYCMEERGLGGDSYHQGRMRKIFVRLLKRVQPDTWYDLMYLPFLSRNTYLSSLDQLAVDEYFGQRSQGARYAPMEDLQRLAWNLSSWVRKRMYLLGLIDLGYDGSDRPVAMRLTRIGARLFGIEDGSISSAPAIGSLIVTPDFEIVMFPTGDDSELVHELDRFCVRDKKGETLHFHVTEKTIHRALTEGMHLSRILATLRNQSRTPVPQNVIFSIRDWANRAGLLFLREDAVLLGEDPEVVRKFLHDAGTRPYVSQAIDETRIQLKKRFSVKRTQSLLRELGFLVELTEEPSPR